MRELSRSEVTEALNVSRETVERLETYDRLLRKWNPAINLVSKASIGDIWTRHILDSAQIMELLPANARLWADLGSGGGFPGLVVGILAAETAPNLSVVLVESDQRKAIFLTAVAREVGVDMQVLSSRIEDTPPLVADVVSARALAALPILLGHAQRHLAPGGVALFPKGAGHQAEIDESLECWRFSVHKHPSRTDEDAVILRIGDIARV